MSNVKVSFGSRKGMSGAIAGAAVVLALAFLVASASYMVPVLAHHTAVVSLEPEWSVAGEMTEYSMQVCNQAGSHHIDEVRVIKNPAYTTFDCVDKSADGWITVKVNPWFDSDLGLTEMCWYYTLDPINNIPDEECETFEFTATVPESGCDLLWKIETRDEHETGSGNYETWNDTTSIDNTEPELIKEVIGFGSDLCPNGPEPGQECWISTESYTTIKVSVEEQGVCGGSGLDYCKITYTIDGGEPITEVDEDLNGELTWEYDMSFDEDSLHILTVECEDLAGNLLLDQESFRVDGTPPETTKDISEPKKIDGFVEYVDTTTEITLTADDPDPTGESCNIGVDKTWYKNTVYTEDVGETPSGYDYCYEPELYCNDNYLRTITPYDEERYDGCIDEVQKECSDGNPQGTEGWYNCVNEYAHARCQVSSDWQLYDGTPITKDEESCHVLYYFSTDELGNMEDMQLNCFFVDKTPPVGSKDIVGPSVEGDGEDVDWWVSYETDIVLDCKDQKPHPSGDEEVCYKVTYDMDPFDLTDDYCDEDLETISQQGYEGDWCCVDAPKTIIFEESTLHGLDYFCRDAVDKKSVIDSEDFRVDALSPIITKEMIGEDHLGDCPPDAEPSDDECYVADNGENGVSISVEDDMTYPECTVDDVSCNYELWWNTDPDSCVNELGPEHLYNFETSQCFVEGGEFGEQGKDIIFTEDSTHELYIYCEDALGNWVDETEQFLVDSKPPETEKILGFPYKLDPECDVVDGKELFSVAEFDGGSGAIWTTTHDCGDESQDLNHFAIGEDVHINGEGFETGMYDWEIVGKPGGASCDPGQVVASGTVNVDESGAFCIHEAYYVANDDCGEYMVNVGVKADNYRVTGEPGDGDGDIGCKQWISSETPVVLIAQDEKVGVDKTYWRNSLVDEDYCSGELNCEEAQGTGEFNEYDGPFYKPEQSCHLIEYYSVDLLGNEETPKKQCVYVDNTAPDPVKEVGYPRVEGEKEGDCGDTVIIDKLDVLFLFDLTGSMDDDLAEVQTNANSIMNDISSLANDAAFGVGSFMDYDGSFESCGYESTYGSAFDGDYAWNLDEDITTDTVAVASTINGLSTAYGADGPEAYARALYEAQFATWRDDAKRVVVIFQDNVPHDCNLGSYGCSDDTTGVDPGRDAAVGGGDDLPWADVVADLVSADITAIVLEADFGQCDGVWQYLADETGGVLSEVGNGEIADQIVALVTEVIGGECEGFDWWVTQNTPISLTCNDPEPHPVGQETLYWRFSTWTDGFDGEPTYSDWQSETYENLPIEINFEEDCWHDLEYYCVDHLGNEGEKHTQYYIVDTVPPEIDKTITGPQLECTEEEAGDFEGDCYAIDGVTEITIDAHDPEPHPVGDITCEWWYILDGDEGTPYYLDSEGERQEGKAALVETPFTINFPEETEHILHVECQDALGNSVDDAEKFLVDKTPPAIWKEYKWPKKLEQCLEWDWVDGICPTRSIIGGDGCGKTKVCVKWADWISSDTKIEAGVEDIGPHQTGIKEVKYRTTLMNNEDCVYERINNDGADLLTPVIMNSDYACDEVEGSGDWTIVDSEDYDEFDFTIGEDSCHLIEIMATDNVEKCSLHKQWVYVDNMGPDPVKTIGEPKDQWTPGENGDPISYFYPEETANCWTGEEGEIECWEATTLTPIVMDCEDPQPHPVGEKKICFKVDVDGEDQTKGYCREYGGYYNRKTGECCRWLEPEMDGEDHSDCDFFGYKDKCDEVQDIECYDNRKLFYFTEETEHNLQYYCVDKLGNKGPVDEEKFKIEGNKFEIPLFKKWNLVSVPFTLLDSRPETVFSKVFFGGEQIPVEEIGQYIDSVWSYDPENVLCENDWCMWKPGEEENTLNNIIPGWGYWVMVTDKPEDECGFKTKCFWHKDNEDPLWIVIGGSLFSPAQTPPSRNLVKGWNLIGYYGTNWEDYDQGDFDFMCGDEYGGFWKFGTPEKYLYGEEAYCALNSLIDTQEGYPRWSSLWSFVNCGNHNTDWLGLNSCISDSPFKAQDRMYAGRGYWIELDVEDMYAPATTCIWNDDFECVWSGGLPI